MRNGKSSKEATLPTAAGEVANDAAPLLAEKKLTFADVLAGPPNGEPCSVRLASVDHSPIGLPELPPVKLYCRNEFETMNHNGAWLHSVRLSGAKEGFNVLETYRDLQRSAKHQVVEFVCAHCRDNTVTIPLLLEGKTLNVGDEVAVRKIGQHPDYAPPIPKRLQRFIDDGKEETELLQKGWRCEHRGEGIAAFTYYRRIVEDHWAKLLGRLLDVAEKLGDADAVELLEKTQEQWKFGQAVNDVAPAIPKRLRIGGANPFALLHDAFSVGVHKVSDAECLATATAGRKVLVELIEGMNEALKDDSELKTAVADLQKFVRKHRNKERA